ncbi:MAG: GNAT family N-acetyltransferase [Candidatus Zixiibacteriota bacterium]|nr:MAG: GNAT family N-acetyltransferase [candidate division Zixibacteria bacterium]
MENLVLRSTKPSDSEFAFQVKKLAFGEYVEQVWGWDENEQRRLHQKRFASQEFCVIQWSGIDVGVLAINREPDNLTVNQLFVLPEYQGKGIGRACMTRIINDAAISGSSVRLRVLKINRRAMVFFERLGFERIGETDTHVHMERSPQTWS